MGMIGQSSMIVIASLLLAACGGGGGGGGGGAPAPAPTPTALTSLSAALPASGSLSASGSQFAASAIVGSVPAAAAAARVAAAASPTFDFTRAEMARLDSSGGVELTLLDAGGSKSVVGQLSGWADFGFILPGLVAALDEAASLSVPGYTSHGETDVLVLDGTGTVELTYTGFAYWLVDDFDPTDETQYQFVIAGGGAFSTSPSPDLTTIASLPATAVYTGKTFGFVAFNAGADGYAPFAGDATLTADFGAGTVDAAFTDLTLHLDETTAYLMGDVTFTDATIDAASASVSGGTAMSYVDDMNPGVGVTPDGGAAFEAGFYGPAAEETAGTWHVSGTNLVQPDPGETAPMVDISGAFGAAR